MVRTQLRGLAVLVIVLVSVPRTGGVQAGQTPPELRERAIRSTAWVSSARKSGSACLIDRENRLLLTNYHVVEENDTVRVAFPAYDRDRLVTDRAYYWDNFGRLCVPGKVLKRDALRDLALVQVESVPDGAVEMPLADSGAAIGEYVYRVGSPGAVGQAWSVRAGTVTSVQVLRLRYPSGQEVNAVVVSSDATPVVGDSGGPVFNRRGELVGVHICGMNNDTVSGATELAEVRRFLRGTEMTEKISTRR